MPFATGESPVRTPAESYCPLVQYASMADYRRHFAQKYCDEPVVTFDSIEIRFWPQHFDHAFFASPYKTRFDTRRAERIDWIAKTLQDPRAELYCGFDKWGNRYTTQRRVSLVNGDYVVVVEFSKSTRAHFVTAFIASAATARSIRTSRSWSRGLNGN